MENSVDGIILDSDYYELVADFSVKALAALLQSIDDALCEINEIDDSCPQIALPPRILWVIQESGYKKIIDNPEYDRKLVYADVIRQEWVLRRCAAKNNLVLNFFKFLEIFTRISYLESGSLVYFDSARSLLQFLVDKFFKNFFILQVLQDIDSDIDFVQWLCEIFDGVEFDRFIYRPQPVFMNDPDSPFCSALDEGKKEFEKYLDEDPDDFENPYDDWSENSDGSSDDAFEQQDLERDLNEERYGYMENTSRSDEDGWYYSDED